jgi:predicted nucleotide-binding protein (sugar kinase/HSP70/actin superfamily)
MGAYGAALYVKEMKKETEGFVTKPGLLSKEDLEEFKHDVASTECKICSNNCRLTINTFSAGRKYISGNRCSKPIANRKRNEELNLYEYKRHLINEYCKPRQATSKPRQATSKPRQATSNKVISNKVIGIPLGLNMYELLPFWSVFFHELGYKICVSPPSSRSMYLSGQDGIPSDTICYPAKLMHGHIRYLLDKGVDAIFYPCMAYNLDEDMGDNHYNCPVVAFYPEVIAANEPGIKATKFIYDYVGIHRPKDFAYNICRILEERLEEKVSLRQVKKACGKAFEEQENYRNKIERAGNEIIAKARKDGRQIIVLAGRPYHIDGEINHGIDQLISGFGAAVITEDTLSRKIGKSSGTVLNQWTYHSRLYAAAHYVAAQDDMNLVQLVSFGCGVDAITTDEVRDILEEKGKIYTQIKIDEITNLGAVRIRLRSLLAAVGGEKADE